MIVRCADVNDSAALLGLYRELVGDAPLGQSEDVHAVLAHLGTEIWCSVSADTLTAMATLHVLPNVTQGGRPYCVIENVVTAPAFRGQGHGRAVMEAAIERAWAVDAYKIMLLSGKTGTARDFYLKLGFTTSEKWGMTMRRVPLRKTS